MSRLSRIGLPLSSVSNTASRRECFCTCRASAYNNFARSWQESFCQPASAARAALTATSTSAALPCATSASFSPVEGSAVSKYFPSTGARHSPPIKCPNRRCRLSSHASDSFGSSGAGPYSIDLNFSTTLIKQTFFPFLILCSGDLQVAILRLLYFVLPQIPHQVIPTLLCTLISHTSSPHAIGCRKSAEYRPVT